MKFTLLLISLLFSSALYAQSLVFGIVPQQSPKKIYSSWQPFISHLSSEIGVDIILRTEKSIPEFEKKLYSGEYDIAYSNPYHYTMAHKTQNHNAIARFDKEIVGILVVKKDSPINSLEDIKGKDFLFPAPKAFAATLLPKYDILNKKQYDLEKLQNFRYVNSHDSVYLGVQRGVGDIGGGIKRTLNKFKNKDDLKVIYTTDKYPSHPISVSNKLNKELSEKIQKALLNMPKKFINPINQKSFKATNNEEYNVVKELAIQMGIFIK